MNSRLHFITLGCAKNEVDTRDMQTRCVEAGYSLTDDPSQAAAIIVNTCAFIQSATEESIATILEVAHWDSVDSKEAKLIVCGCLPARYGAELDPELPEVTAFIPCANEDDIVDVLASSIGLPSLPEGCSLSPSLVLDSQASPYVAYIKISDGCSRFCSYCTIPMIRGAYHSFTLGQILSECAIAVDNGARELVLIGQDTGLWGCDLSPRQGLSNLLAALAKQFPEVWIRVLYIQPEGITAELLDCIAEHENICRYLDIPLQHCEESVLHAMNRKGSKGQYLQMVEDIRARIPDIALRTTFMVGFPGETEEDFASLCDFAETAAFDYAGIFAYSPEDGTKGADMPDQVAESEKQERERELREVCDTISAAIISQRVGAKVQMLIEGQEEDGQLYGRCQFQAPEVDGETFVDSGDIGSFAMVSIQDTMFYEMEAVVV